MRRIEELLEDLADRGEPRGAAHVWARATAAPTSRSRVRHPRRRLAIAFAGLVAVSVAGGVVASQRDDDSSVLNATADASGATGAATSSGRLVTCTMRHGDEFTSAQLDSRVVPASTTVTLGADHRFVIEVYLDAELKKRLRVTVFGPSSGSTNPSLPAGAIGAAEGFFVQGGDYVSLAGTFDGGVSFSCSDEVSRRDDASRATTLDVVRPVVRSSTDACFEMSAGASEPSACLLPGVSYWLLSGDLFVVARAPIEFSDGSSAPVGNDGFAFARVGTRTVKPPSATACDPLSLGQAVAASPTAAKYPWLPTRCALADDIPIAAVIEYSPSPGKSTSVFLAKIGDGWQEVGEYRGPGAPACGQLTGTGQAICRSLGFGD